MRPWKTELLVPAWPAKESVPRVTVRLQARWWRFFFVCTTHLPLTLRPPTLWVNDKLTLAAWLSVKENVVPTGGRFALRAKLASRVPSRHLWLDSATLVRTGAPAAAVNVRFPAVVNVRSALVLVPSGLVAITRKWKVVPDASAESCVSSATGLSAVADCGVVLEP